MVRNTTATLPTTSNRARADEYAKLNTRRTFDGRLVARVVEVTDGRYAVLVDHVAGKVRTPRGVVPL